MAVSITSTSDPAGASSVASVSTYSVVSTGAAASNRIVAVTITAKAATVPTGVAINTGGADIWMVPAASAIFSTVGAWIYQTLVPNGSTATVKVNWTAAVTSLTNHISLYRIVGADTAPSLAVVGSSSDMDATSPLTVAFTTPAGGAALAVAGGAASGSAKTWVGLTAVTDEGTGGAAGHRHSTAASTTPSATVTCTGGTNGEDGAIACVVYQVASGRLGLPPPQVLQPLITQ